MRQDEQWLGWLDDVKKHEAWERFRPEGREFLLCFQSHLRTGASPPCRNGDRCKVVGPFTKALKELLRARGIKPDQSAASVDVAPGIRRAADVSFQASGVTWVIEIKIGLEFNSLGAAVLEALAFRTKRPAARLCLVSLYAKSSKYDEDNVQRVLQNCGVPESFHDVFILLRATDRNWCASFVDRTNALLEYLPNLRTVSSVA
jgi:hypothetical protein